jgi:CheY-like chemotaxis protein
LPASQTPAALSAAATTPAAAPTPATPFAPARILVADDSPDNQFVIQRLLKKLGQACDLVDDGEQAVEAARDKSYDLIFMDIMMPKLNGLEALREIRAFKGQNGKVPIVAMTARVMKEDCDSYIAAGANAVLPKPVDLESLRQVLARNLKTRAHSTEERH